MAKDGKACAVSREKPSLSVDQEEYYIPSVDLLTAQVMICSHHIPVRVLAIINISYLYYFFTIIGALFLSFLVNDGAPQYFRYSSV